MVRVILNWRMLTSTWQAWTWRFDGRRKKKPTQCSYRWLYLKLVKQKPSFLAPLNISRLQFSAVHILKNASILPWKPLCSLWLAPQMDSPFGGENSQEKSPSPLCPSSLCIQGGWWKAGPFWGKQVGDIPGLSRGDCCKEEQESQRKKKQGWRHLKLQKREKSLQLSCSLRGFFFSILHEKLNFAMGRTRLPKLLPQCLLLKYKIHQSKKSDSWTGKLVMRIRVFKPSLFFSATVKIWYSMFSGYLERGDSYLPSGRAKIQKLSWVYPSNWIILSGFSRQSQHQDSDALGKEYTSFLLKHEIFWAKTPAPKDHFASPLALGWEC